MTARAPRPRPVLSNVTSWSNVQLLRLGLRPRSQGWLSVVGVPTGLLLTPVRVDLGVSGSSVRYLLASNMDWDWVASARNADLAVLTYRDVDRRVGVTSRRVVLADITGELTSFTDSVLTPLAKSAATVAEPGTSHIVLHVSDTAENDFSPQPIPPDSDLPMSADRMIALLGVYASQYASYTTLLWQVPALGLTAQSFLLTLALTRESGNVARTIACVLGALIAISSYFLMHGQRGRAINYAALLRRLSGRRGLRLRETLGPLDYRDGTPPHADPVSMWDVDHPVYHVWRALMVLLAVADLAILIATYAYPTWLK